MEEQFGHSKVLVVGGAGFVGSRLVRALFELNTPEVVVIDNLLSSEKENLPQDTKLEFIQGSITDDKILAEVSDDFDYIFHLSTYHGNQSSICDPIADHENNTYTTLKLCERIKGFKKIKKVVYASAGCVVAKKTYASASATTEDALPSLYLDSPYQISKMIGEFYLNYYFKQYGLPVVKARFQNVYGPGEVLGAGQWRGTPHTVWRNVLPTFMYKAMHEQALTVDNGGVATRDFIFVDDLVQGLLACAVSGQDGDTYNLASGVETSIIDLAKQINVLTCNPTDLLLGPKRSWDNSGKRYGSTKKSKNTLGFVATTSLETGLQRTYAWFQENITWINTCIAKHAVHLT